MWLWICGYEDVEDDLRLYIRTSIFGATYAVHNAEYIPAPAERLEDLTANSSKARAPVRLIFLIKRGAKIKSKKIPRRFEAHHLPKWSKPGLYSELEYRLYDTELRMEFYIRILDLFCHARDNVLSVFSGGKIVCAAWVCFS